MGPREAQGAEGLGPHHALATLCTTPGLAPLPWVRGGPRRLGQGGVPGVIWAPFLLKYQPHPPPVQLWGRGSGSHFPALPLSFLTRRHYRSGGERESQTGGQADPSRRPPGGHGPPFSLRQCLEWREAAPSPIPDPDPGEGRPRHLAPAWPGEAHPRAVSGAGWALNAKDSP